MPKAISHTVNYRGKNSGDVDVEIPVAEDLVTVPGVPMRGKDISYYSRVYPLAARGRSTFSELRWYPPMEAAKGSLSWVFRAKQPESVRTGP